MTAKEIQKRIRIVLRAFQWKMPLPEGFVERMEEYDNGTNRNEEMWNNPYRLGSNHENRCMEQKALEEEQWNKWVEEKT